MDTLKFQSTAEFGNRALRCLVAVRAFFWLPSMAASAAPTAVVAFEPLGAPIAATGPKSTVLKPQSYITVAADELLGGGRQCYLVNALSKEVVPLEGGGWEAEAFSNHASL